MCFLNSYIEMDIIHEKLQIPCWKQTVNSSMQATDKMNNSKDPPAIKLENTLMYNLICSPVIDKSISQSINNGLTCPHVHASLSLHSKIMV